jgi:hypothetical protein
MMLTGAQKSSSFLEKKFTLIVCEHYDRFVSFGWFIFAKSTEWSDIGFFV